MTPRLRMFAGPNGSGKSRLKGYLSPDLLGLYLNADEVELSVRNDGYLDFNQFDVQLDKDRVRLFFENSGLLHKAGLTNQLHLLSINGNRIDFSKITFNSYFASVVIEFVRRELLKAGVTFTFETVMSHASKIDVLRQAHDCGYRTYLYYVATDDPMVNISRVHYRAHQGGHSVPDDKIVDRYYRSLGLLIEAIAHTDRAYIFDNSAHGGANTWLAEITAGKTLLLKTDEVPAWFKTYVLDRFAPSETT
jgi:predicted ABC-type ATPase